MSDERKLCSCAHAPLPILLCGLKKSDKGSHPLYQQVQGVHCLGHTFRIIVSQVVSQVSEKLPLCHAGKYPQFFQTVQNVQKCNGIGAFLQQAMDRGKQTLAHRILHLGEAIDQLIQMLHVLF